MMYYTSAKPVPFHKIIETEIERGNSTQDQVNHWKLKYKIEDNDKAVWVSPKKWVANSYNLSAEERDTAHKIPESDMDITSIPSSKGFIIKESDDGDDGYIFVFKRGIIASDDRLQELLKTMNVPPLRKNDYGWLSRNIWIQNKNHPNLSEVLDIIKKNLKRASEETAMSTALRKIIDKLPTDKKLAMFDGKPELKVYSQTENKKPRGLWYSCGREWMKWVLSEKPKWTEPYIYSIKVSGNVLKITNEKELKEFDDKYGKTSEIFKDDKIFKNINNNIDWPKVSEKYDGIEICPYEKNWAYGINPKIEWFGYWDVASGCIWGKSAFTGHELEAYYDGEKYILKGDKDFNPPENIKSAVSIPRVIAMCLSYAYPGNIGMEEMFKFWNEAKADAKEKMLRLFKENKYKEIIQLLRETVNPKLYPVQGIEGKENKNG